MSNNDTHSRRRVLKGAGVTGAAGMMALAGCLTGDEDDENTLEVLHGWTGGDGAEAEEALFAAFEEEHPDIDLDDQAIGGGGNENLDQTVATRFNSDNPPGSFAGWPGANLEQYDGVLGDIESEVWDEADLADAHVEEAVEACQFDGGYSAVPIGSHRMNDLFYNVEVLEDAGVDPDSLDDIDALIDALDTVDSETDATPLAMSLEAWAILQTWAVVMLSTQGYDAYMDFIAGDGDEDAVRETFETLEEILDNYINDDAASVGFTEVNQDIMGGDAAFIHEGNWVAGAYINNEDIEYGEEWDAIRYPGTEDMYGLHIDSFIYPGDNPAPEETATFLRFAGGETAQVEFNQYKGSIPTREGVPTEEFNEYLTETIEDFETASEKPPTLAHGLAVDQSTQSSLEEVLNNNFADPFDVDDATEGFMNAV
ncbi:ABC transporter substrate-binding protein [Halostagnicola sp. A-GB9-2]|uniref:ABC transporter substrate-binding protein n=1 Tax=Halostagnicola sp. A-GB9-2 TaxID=3048066 RepID=UPI0024BFF5FE|nr:ABC transporter substrate-binding protein [Halostagnicola sp. A-GB9-2]MDJ1434018.1 ABC transporter substrate-binding protein [Halostagnicola sp. A-GB9-2]